MSGRSLGILRSGQFGGVAPAELAARFGTPLYAYDLDVMTRRAAGLRKVLPPVCDVAYALKANPALAVVAHLGGLGFGADVASGGELETALRAGIAPTRIVFTGPGKRDDELAAAVRAGVRAVTVESAGELARLESIAAAAGRRVPVLLRAAVRPTPQAGMPLVSEGAAGKFGMDVAELVPAARRAAGSRHLEWLGVHAFGASNVVDAAVLITHIRATVALGVELARVAGADLRLVDVGGGLGIPYAARHPSLDLAAFGAALGALAAGWSDDPGLREVRVLIEPGRFLVGPAGAYVCRVVDRKEVEGTTIVVLDGGIHHLARPALVGQEHRIRRLGPAVARSSRRPVTFAGPLCTGLDVFARRRLIVPPEVGDLVALLDAGAYGYTESMPLFLSHPMPAEVAIRRGRAELMRPRLEPSEWLDCQSLPTWTPEPMSGPRGHRFASQPQPRRNVRRCGARLRFVS